MEKISSEQVSLHLLGIIIIFCLIHALVRYHGAAVTACVWQEVKRPSGLRRVWRSRRSIEWSNRGSRDLEQTGAG